MTYSFIKLSYFESDTLFNKLKMEKSKKHNREFLLYEYQLGNNAVITVRNICVAKGQGAVSNVTAKRWFKRFRNGDYSLQEDQTSGLPMKINLAE